ncbi:trypsin-like peptidase domain-containing protein [Embleya sp. NPDC008237]|uniref:trypsin-like peptidase domain-containing protein n=1 Tax=Embleya sp. NPDC008237 TaxID=3363978 RepID=UPI0036EF9840
MVEFDRRVQVRVRLAGVEGRGFGSGYLLAPRLVLTAAHVLDGMAAPGRPDTVTVSRPGRGEREFPATVVWRRKDALVDAALVAITDTDPEHRWPVPESLGDLIARPPQRFGHLIGTRPHPVTLLGFPRMQKDPDDGDRLDEQVTGRVPPGAPGPFDDVQHLEGQVSQGRFVGGPIGCEVGGHPFDHPPGPPPTTGTATTPETSVGTKTLPVRNDPPPDASVSAVGAGMQFICQLRFPRRWLLAMGTLGVSLCGVKQMVVGMAKVFVWVIPHPRIGIWLFCRFRESSA